MGLNGQRAPPSTDWPHMASGAWIDVLDAACGVAEERPERVDRERRGRRHRRACSGIGVFDLRRLIDLVESLLAPFRAGAGEQLLDVGPSLRVGAAGEREAAADRVDQSSGVFRPTRWATTSRTVACQRPGLAASAIALSRSIWPKMVRAPAVACGRLAVAV